MKRSCRALHIIDLNHNKVITLVNFQYHTECFNTFDLILLHSEYISILKSTKTDHNIKHNDSATSKQKICNTKGIEQGNDGI